MELHAYSCDLHLLLKISIYLDLLKYGCHSFIAYARDGRNGSLWSSQHILCWGSEAEEELSNKRKYRWKICLLLYLLLPNSVQRCDDALVLSDVVHKSRYPARVNETEKTTSPPCQWMFRITSWARACDCCRWFARTEHDPHGVGGINH